MEFFSDHWFLWLCFFAPAMSWLGLGRIAKSPIVGTRLAHVVAWISGMLLVFGLVHVTVGVILGVLF